MESTKMMINKEIIIDANVAKVWDIMLNHPTYEEWTAEFEPTSTFIGSWDLGDEIRFTSTEHGGGMVCKIVQNELHKVVGMEYIGILKKDDSGIDHIESAMIKGATEIYTFEDLGNNQTRLIIAAQTSNDWFSFLEPAWPKALTKLKEICER